MRTFADPSFFRLVYALIGEAKAEVRRTKWAHRGVDWTRIRHSFTDSHSSFAIDQYVIVKPDRNGWTLLVVKEAWWDGDDKPIRSTQWAKALSGVRSEIMAWLKAEERRINARTFPEVGR